MHHLIQPAVAAGSGVHLLPALSHSVHLLASSRLRLSRVVMVASSQTVPYKKEHLVWEEGFRPRFVGSLFVCCLLALGASRSQEAWLRGMAAQGWAQQLLLRLFHRLEWWTALGLLSSSCCVLQLLLNALSVGCAGFNTVLGPLRPQLMALTTMLQMWMWYGEPKRGTALWLSALPATAVTAVLTFLPELLHCWIHRGDGVAAARAPGGDICLQVEGMGCTACTAKVKSALELMPEVDSVSVSLQRGSATLRLVAPPSDPLELQQKVASTLSKAGFSGGREAPSC